jgi:DhnA family fructose-bisphosphate aldolase class Ia
MLIDPRKYLRFPALYNRDEPIIVCPFDDSLISGPIGGLERAHEKLASIIEARPTAVLTFTGTVLQHVESFVGAPAIINLSGSTTRSHYTRKVPVASVQTALELSAAAVAVHVNLSSKHAPEMLEHAGEVVEAARSRGVPVVGIMYPRGDREDGKPEEFLTLLKSDPRAYTELVGHCVQVGVDLGVDLIKTQYTGSTESFREIVYLAGKTPVITAGGPLIDETAAVANAVAALEAGAAGTSFARNTFGRKEPRVFIETLRDALRSAMRKR